MAEPQTVRRGRYRPPSRGGQWEIRGIGNGEWGMGNGGGNGEPALLRGEPRVGGLIQEYAEEGAKFHYQESRWTCTATATHLPLALHSPFPMPSSPKKRKGPACGGAFWLRFGCGTTLTGSARRPSFPWSPGRPQGRPRSPDPRRPQSRRIHLPRRRIRCGTWRDE